MSDLPPWPHQAYRDEIKAKVAQLANRLASLKKANEYGPLPSPPHPPPIPMLQGFPLLQRHMCTKHTL